MFRNRLAKSIGVFCFILSCCVQTFAAEGDIIWQVQNDKFEGYFNENLAVCSSWHMIFISVEDGLIAFSTIDGSEKWQFSIEENFGSPTYFGPPSVDVARNTVYATSCGNKLYAIDKNGSKKWEFPIVVYSEEEKYCAFQSPSIGEDGTVYTGSSDGILYAIRPDGTLKWKFDTNSSVGIISIAIDKNDNIFFVAGDNKFYAIDKNGNMLLSKTYGIEIYEPFEEKPIIIGTDGLIYFHTFVKNKYIYAVKSDGTLKWKCYIPHVPNCDPVIDASGTIYVTNEVGELYAVDHNSGAIKWSYKGEYIGDQGGILAWFHPPVIGKDGKIFQPTSRGYIAVLFPDGTLTDTYNIGDYTINDIKMDSNGTIYGTGTKGDLGKANILFAIVTASPGPASSGWPMSGHDERNSGRSQYSVDVSSENTNDNSGTEQPTAETGGGSSSGGGGCFIQALLGTRCYH